MRKNESQDELPSSGSIENLWWASLRGQCHLSAGHTGRGQPSTDRYRRAHCTIAIEGEDNRGGSPVYYPFDTAVHNPSRLPTEQRCPN
jgi:hypothetical protein